VFEAVIDVPAANSTFTLTAAQTAASVLRRRAYYGKLWLEAGGLSEVGFRALVEVQR
jgi:hypothetical protein